MAYKPAIKDDTTLCKKCGTKLQTAASKQGQMCEGCRKSNRWIGPKPQVTKQDLVELWAAMYRGTGQQKPPDGSVQSPFGILKISS